MADIHPQPGSSLKTLAEQRIKPAGHIWVISSDHMSWHYLERVLGSTVTVLGNMAGSQGSPNLMSFPQPGFKTDQH